MKLSALTKALFCGFLFALGVLAGHIYTKHRIIPVCKKVLQERTEEKLRAEKDLNACLAVLEDDEIGTYILSDDKGVTE